MIVIPFNLNWSVSIQTFSRASLYSFTVDAGSGAVGETDGETDEPIACSKAERSSGISASGVDEERHDSDRHERTKTITTIEFMAAYNKRSENPILSEVVK